MTKTSYEFRGMTIPPIMLDALNGYIEHGYQVGHFLRAVLENDLKGAVDRADDVNIKVLPAYVVYLYNEAPAGCWGSKERVQNWIDGFLVEPEV